MVMGILPSTLDSMAVKYGMPYDALSWVLAMWPAGVIIGSLVGGLGVKHGYVKASHCLVISMFGSGLIILLYPFMPNLVLMGLVLVLADTFAGSSAVGKISIQLFSYLR